MFRSNLVALVAVACAVAALVLTLWTRWTPEPSLATVGCRYLESIGDAHNLPVTACRLVSHDGDVAVFGITQDGTHYTLRVIVAHSPWQVLAATQQ
jgi:hypothetical protein